MNTRTELSEIILAIARYEFEYQPWGHYYFNGLQWLETDTNVFDPLGSWSDLMPLVVKYGESHGLVITPCKIVDSEVSILPKHAPFDKFVGLYTIDRDFEVLADTYQEAAIRAIYSIITDIDKNEKETKNE